MKICFFGSYVKNSFGIPSGNSGTLLKKNLETQNVEIIECHEPLEKISSFFFPFSLFTLLNFLYNVNNINFLIVR